MVVLGHFNRPYKEEVGLMRVGVVVVAERLLPADREADEGVNSRKDRR